MASPLRYRPIRTALWGVFLFLALGFVGLVVFSVLRSVLSEQKLAQSEAGGASDPATCAQDLARLYADVHTELDAQRAAGSSDRDWAPLRARLLALGARCPVKSGAADPLSRAYARVVELQRLAESAATQYRHEVGPTDAEALKQLQAAGAKL